MAEVQKSISWTTYSRFAFPKGEEGYVRLTKESEGENVAFWCANMVNFFSEKNGRKFSNEDLLDGLNMELHYVLLADQEILNVWYGSEKHTPTKDEILQRVEGAITKVKSHLSARV